MNTSLQNQLVKAKIIPDPLKDQFFLTDETVLSTMVELAEINKNDTVLEIGVGLGQLTKKIAEKAKKVIAFEIDERFKPLLVDLPKNVDLRFKDAWEYVQLRGKFPKKKPYNKIVANPPFSFIEKLLHNLTFTIYDKTILLVPLGFIEVINSNGIFTSFFRAEVKLHVPKEAFYPIPKTNCAVIELSKLPDPLVSHNLPIFLRQYVYQHEDQLVKNSLTEALVRYNKLANKYQMTKNEARKLIADQLGNTNDLNLKPVAIDIYDMISVGFNTIST